MYCPKRGQQQISEEMRFCSRCGFSLGGVKDFIASSDPPVEQRIEAPAGQPNPGMRNVRRGVWMILASFVLALIVGLLANIDDDFAVLLLLPFLCLVFGFVRVLYGVFLADKRAAKKALKSEPADGSSLPDQISAARNLELPPAPVAPSFVPRRVETAEMLQPPSVTENTTRLLEDESNLQR